MEESSFDEDDEERELTIEDVLRSTDSPGFQMKQGGYDLPLIRDKQNNHTCMEIIVSAIVNGCIFGKLCLQSSKEPRTWLYNTITLTDTFMVSLHKNDIYRMLEN